MLSCAYFVVHLGMSSCNACGTVAFLGDGGVVTVCLVVGVVNVSLEGLSGIG